MRNMSFSLTTEQMRRREKTVTRRIGWDFIRPGDHILAVEKGMGLKKGEKIKAICEIIVLSVRREPLQRMLEDSGYGQGEAIREGFSHLSGAGFVDMFCEHHGVTPTYAPNRIEFAFL